MHRHKIRWWARNIWSRSMSSRSSWSEWWTSNRWLLNLEQTFSKSHFSSNSNSVGGKTFDQMDVNYVSMYLDKRNVHQLYYSPAMVLVNFHYHSFILFVICTGMRGNQHFIYDFKSFHIIHVSTRLCLDCDLESKKVFMERCNRTSKTQQWTFLSYNETLILKDMRQYFLEWYEFFCVFLRSNFCDTIYYFFNSWLI